jgi:hypothetical protein
LWLERSAALRRPDFIKLASVCRCRTYNVTVPINARATVYVPAESKASVNEVGAMFGVRFLRMANSTGTPSVPLALFEVGSGSYSFSSQYQG